MTCSSFRLLLLRSQKHWQLSLFPHAAHRFAERGAVWEGKAEDEWQAGPEQLSMSTGDVIAWLWACGSSFTCVVVLSATQVTNRVRRCNRG